MIKVMFWNIDRAPDAKRLNFEQTICEVVNKEKVEILLLAEAMNVDDTIIENNSALKRIKPFLPSDQIDLTPRFYSTNNGFKLEHYHTVQNTKRLVFCFLEMPKRPLLVLAGIHFPSKLEYDGQTQADIANSYINWINKAEGGTKRTILFGDFNMNPFEIGMIGPKTFNATLSKVLAKTGPRTFQRPDRFDYFYNPMWTFMGDIDEASRKHKLPGSYYLYSTGDSSITYWNVFDKVLLRPDVIDDIDIDSIKYLMKSGKHEFVTVAKNEKYKIERSKYSDHVPLVFNIK